MQRQNTNQIKHKDEIQILNTITKYKGVHLHRTVDKIAPIWARRCRTGAWGGWWYAGKRSALGKPPFQKSAVFLNIVQKAFDPPPFYLNICPILQGVFFERVFEHLI